MAAFSTVLFQQVQKSVYTRFIDKIPQKCYDSIIKNYCGEKMEILYFFEGLRHPFFDKFFYLITALGAEVFFIALAITVYWCINKRFGYYLMTVCFFGAVINQILKLICRVPRPWIIDPDFSIVEIARSGAPGYSFPSGHTQNAVSIAGCFAMSSKELAKTKKSRVALYISCGLLALFVAISRMYLGVHTSWDVLISALLAVFLVLLFYYVFRLVDKKPSAMYIIIAGMVAISAVYLVISYMAQGFDAHEIENVISSRRHAWYMMGGVCGIAVAYPIERRFVRFETKASLVCNIIKIVPGVAGVFGIKMLEEPLLALFGGAGVAHGVRYFLIVVFAVCVWPATFRFISKIGQKKS